MKKLILTSILLLWASLSVVYSQATINVPADQSTIQAALDLAEEGTTILIAPGTYFENLIWPEDINDIKLIGEQGKELTIIDGGGVGRVIAMEGGFALDPIRSTLEGLTIQNGFVSDEYGAGLYTSYIVPNLKDLVFRSNRATGAITRGVGAFLDNYFGEIEGCEFIDNEVENSNESYGVGLYVELAGDASILNCAFRNNSANTIIRAYGGGLYARSGYQPSTISVLTISNCVFENNNMITENWSYGAGAYIDEWDELEVKIDSTNFINNVNNVSLWSHGGGLHCGTNVAEINECTFLNNAAESGGGIYFSNASTSLQKPIIKNSVFSYNEALNGNTPSGAAFFIGNDPMELTLENCIISHNEGTTINFTSGLGQVNPASLTLNHCTVAYNSGSLDVNEIILNATNSIFWNNGQEEILQNDWSDNDYNLSNCIVKNGFEGKAIIDADPLFISENLLIPSENSPCLNAGASVGVDQDFFSNPRPMPTNSYPDIGAYEIDQYFAHVLVKFFLDENEDGIKDPEEHYTSLGSIKVDQSTNVNNFRQEGIFVIAEQGALEISYEESWDPNWLVTGQTDYFINIDTENFSELIEFGLTPRFDIMDVQALITSGSFRCGEEVDFSLILKNRGTVIADGIAWLRIDERVVDYYYPITPDHVIGDHLVGWNFDELLPGECYEFDFVITAPLITSVEQVGELHCFIVELEIEENSRSNIFEYKAELRCSYDPNDKLVNPFRPDSLALVGTDLLYTIRFQNTGNDYARNVVVTDTLNENFDMASFELINSSHPDLLQLSIADDRAVKFEFNGIYLPDSLTNEPASHGFINYTIRPIEDVVLNTNITNTAHIYFDFNPAIVTNTTQSIMVEEFPTVGFEELSEISIQAHPNPATNEIHLSEEVDRVHVYDALGKLVLEVENVKRVELNGMEVGNYFVEYHVNGKLMYDKWVIMR